MEHTSETVGPMQKGNVWGGSPFTLQDGIVKIDWLGMDLRVSAVHLAAACLLFTKKKKKIRQEIVFSVTGGGLRLNKSRGRQFHPFALIYIDQGFGKPERDLPCSYEAIKQLLDAIQKLGGPTVEYLQQHAHYVATHGTSI